MRRTSAEKERVQAEIYDAEIALAQKQAEVRAQQRTDMHGGVDATGSASSLLYSFCTCGQLERDIQEYHKVASELKVIPSTGEPPSKTTGCRA